jgi:hypothetical protein
MRPRQGASGGPCYSRFGHERGQGAVENGRLPYSSQGGNRIAILPPAPVSSTASRWSARA